MKKINRWTICFIIAALLVGTTGMLPAQAAGPQLRVETPDNKVPTYQYREAQDFVLNVENTGDEKLTDVRIAPLMKNQESKWPFKTEYQSYEAVLKELGEGETGQAVFSFVQRDDAGSKRYTLTFRITASNEAGQSVIDQEQSFYINTTAKPEEDKNESGGSSQQNGGEGSAGADMQAGGSFSTSEAVYSGGSGSGSVPRVIVTGFTTNPAEVRAGSDFTLTIHLKNTSKQSNVKNMLFELVAPTEGADEQTAAAAFLPSSGSNSIYLEGIAAQGTADIAIQLNAKADLVQKPYAVELTMKYEDSTAAQIDSSANISIPVKQEARFEFSEFEITPESIEIGEEANVACSLYNLGRIKLYNAKAVFTGEGIKKKEVFLGNLEPGSSTSIDAMLEGTKVSDTEGKVKMTLSYEDQEGQLAETEKEFSLLVSEAEESVPMDGEILPEESSGFPVFLIIGILVAAAGITVAVILNKRRKKRRLLEEEEELLDELDGSSEDEQQ